VTGGGLPASLAPDFRTANVAVQPGFLTAQECADLIRAMGESPSETAQVVRAGQSILDQSLRNCLDHHLPEPVKIAVGDLMLDYFRAHCGAFDSDADAIYGPYFMSYSAGSFFRAHRDVANHRDDPPRLAAHRWSLLLYLNGRRADSELPGFEGGALTIYDTALIRRDRRVVVVPEPGLLVLFRSHLMHEVALVREGTRYAAAGWMSTSTSPLGGRS
jgi:SM-20-related protein